MKKGSAGPLVAIVLGLIVIVIILFTFGKPMVDQLKSFFAPGGLASPNQEQQGNVLIPGTQVKEGQWATVKLEGDKDEVLNGLADLLLSCWATMKKAGGRPQQCFKVELCPLTERGYECSPRPAEPVASDTGEFRYTPPAQDSQVLTVFYTYDSTGRPVQVGGDREPVRPAGIITRSELVAKLRSRGITDAADALDANWGTGNVVGESRRLVNTVEGESTYTLCAFDSYRPYDDLLFFALQSDFACAG